MIAKIDWEAVRRARANVRTTAELEASGLDRHARLRRQRSGELVEVLPGAWINASDVPTLPTMLHAVKASQGERAVFSDVTAGWFHRLDGCSAPALHVTVPYGCNSRSLPGLDIHSSRRVLPEDVCSMSGFSVLNIPATIVDFALSKDRRHLVAAYEDNRRRGRKARAALSRYLRERCTGLDLSILTDLMSRREDDEPSTESWAESIFDDILWRHGIQLSRQVTIVTPSHDFLGRVDFASISLRVAFEMDGRKYHENDYRFRADRARDRRMKALMDWDVVRYTVGDLADEAGLAKEVWTILERRRRQLFPNWYSTVMPTHQMAFGF